MWLILRRSFTSCTTAQVKRNKLPPRPKFTPEMEKECTEVFLHGGTGPGGQKINKTNSKVQLKHIPTGIVVTCQETRSREQNRQRAREKMAHEIDKFMNHSDGSLTERELALRQLARQNKKSKQRKSRLKHELHREENERLKLEQQERDNELIKKMLGS